MAVGIAAAMVVPTSAVAAETPPCTETAATERDAARIAKACNRFVEVSSSVSERSRVVALPSGVLEWQEFAVPVRVRQGDGWAPVDTALQVFADGRIGPRASTVDIRFSPGGSGSLVTMSAGGGSASLSWPTALPAPVLEGDTAVYREVAADIDLRLRATATGFTHVLVIKTAAAAANPMLRAIRYGWSAQGLQLRSRADGGVDIADGSGAVVLSAAPGSMWDSSPGTPTGAQARMLSGAEGNTVTADASDATSAGDGARVAAVQVQVSASELTVVPDAAMLSGDGVVFPLYVDPPVNADKNRWGYANTGGHNQNDGVARVGKNPECCGGVWRSYFEFDISPLAGKTIYDSRFYITATHSSPCAATPVNLWVTGNMQSVPNGTRTAWAPAMDSWADERSVAANAGCSGVTSPKPMEFGYNLYYHVRWRTDRAHSNMTLGLATYNQDGYGESVDYWKKFDPTTAAMKIWYNTHPNTPVAQNFASSECFKACKSTTGTSTLAHQAQGWWKLNETSGTTAADAASPAHPLTKAGSGTVGWAEGGATFNNAYLQASTKVLDTTKSFTVSAWAKLSDTNGYHTIVSQDGTSGSGFHLRFDWGHQRWAFVRQATDSTDPAGAYATSTAAPTLNVWTHLVGVYVNEGREKSATLYVNGVRQSTVWADPVFSANYGLQVGRAKWAGGVSDVFAGGIDNVQVYQRQLKDAEVSTLYGASRPGGALHITPAQVRTATPTLKVQASDAEANAQLWTEFEVRTAPTETATLLHATGGIGPHSTPATVSNTVPSGKFSNGGTYYWRARSADELGWYGFWSAFQAVKVDTSPPTFGSPTVASTQYPLKQWGALAGTQGSFTLKASTDTTEFEWWVDGGTHNKVSNVSSGTATVSYTPATDMVHVLHVKAKDIAGNVMTTQHDYEFWVKPLPEKYSLWKFDEPSGSTAADTGTGGTPVPATLAGGAAFTAQGRFGGAADFPGSGSRVSTSVPVLDTTRDFTVMAWVRPTSLGAAATQTIVAQSGTTHSRFELQFQQSANNGYGGWCFVMTGTSSGGSKVSACVGAELIDPPDDNLWVHVAGRYQASTGKMQAYVMGGTGSCNGDFREEAAPTAWSAERSFEIGRGWSASAGTSYWRGQIDDVRAYQRALAPSEICQQALQP